MNLVKRINNLWKLSEYKPREIGSPPLEVGTVVAQIIKKPAEFIKYNPKTPVEEFISEQKPQ
jgi:hypothetical protein